MLNSKTQSGIDFKRIARTYDNIYGILLTLVSITYPRLNIHIEYLVFSRLFYWFCYFLNTF